LTSTSEPEGLRHDAFISYHRASSIRQARALQNSLERTARRSERDIDVFRDETRLPIGQLDESINGALARSKHLIVVLHAETASSESVDEEVATWLERGGSPDRLHLAVIDPSLQLSWDEGCFRSAGPLPPSLSGGFASEPLWLTLHAGRTGRRLVDDSLQIPRLCATVLGCDPAEVLQREARAQRRTRVLLATGVATLAVLLVVALIASVLAVRARGEAQRRAAEATAQANLSEALLLSQRGPERAVDLLLASSKGPATSALRSGIHAALEAQPRLLKAVSPPASFGGRPPDDIVYSASGDRLAGWLRTTTPEGAEQMRVVVWDTASWRVMIDTSFNGRFALNQTHFVGEDQLVSCDNDRPVLLPLSGGKPAEILASGPLCVIVALQGGVSILAGPGGSAHAILLGASGERTEIIGIGDYTTVPGADYALVRTASGTSVVRADGTGRQEITGLPAGDYRQLLADEHSTFIVTAGPAAETYLIAPLRGSAAATRLAVPPRVQAVAPIPSLTGDFVWLDERNELGWTLSPVRLALSDLDPQNTNSARPALWVSDDGGFLVVASGRKGVVIDVDTHALTLARRRDVNVSADANRVLLAPGERGPKHVVLPIGTGFTVVESDRDVRADGLGIVLPDSSDSVLAMGTRDLRLVHPYEDPEVLASDVAAYAIDPFKRSIAAVRSSGAVLVFTLAERLRVPSLTVVEYASPTLEAGNGAGRVTWTGNGLDFASGDRSRLVPTADNDVSRILAVSPDGSAAAVTLGNPDLDRSTASTTLVRADGTIKPLGTRCSYDLNLTFVPRRDFERSVADAERFTLVAHSGSGATESVTPCDDAANAEEVAKPSEVLTYSLDRSGGTIVVKRGDNVSLTNWARGDAAPRTISLPGSEGLVAGWYEAGTGTFASWTADGRVSISNRADRFRSARGLRPNLGDIVAVRTVPDLGLIVVIGRGGIVEVYDAGELRLVLRHTFDLAAARNDKSDEIIRRVTVDARSERLEVLAEYGSSNSAVNYKTLNTPFDMASLRRKLCEIRAGVC